MRESRAYFGYAAGIAAALGFAFAMTLQGNEHGVVMMPMLAAIMIAAYIGGRNAGLVTTFVAFAASLYVASPAGILWVSNVHDLERVIGIATLGAATSFTIEALHRARRRAEAAYEAAHRGEARFARMFVASPVANSLSRLSDGVVIDVNAAYLRTFGVAYDAIVGTTPVRAGIIVDDGAREAMFTALRSAKDGTREVEVGVRTPDGQRRELFVSSQLIEVDGEELVLSSYLCMTARRRAEAKANEAGMRLRELAELVEASFWIVDPLRGRLLYISPGYEKIFGRTCESHLANPDQWLEAVHPDDAVQVRAWVSSGVINDGESREFRIVRSDGAVRWVSTRVYARRDASGTLTRIAGVTEDITVRKQAEAEAETSRQQFKQLAEAIDEVIWMLDARTGQRLYISPAYEKVWGRPASELWASPDAWMDAVHPDDRDRVMKAFRGGEQRVAYEEKYRIVRPDGSLRWIRDKAFPIRDERGEVTRLAGIAQDITEVLRVAEKLQQTQKLESIGLLAGGVAHDFNNTLCAITANAEMLADAMPQSDPRSEWIGEIQTAAERASGLTRQLLAFGRKQIVNPIVLDLNRSVDDARRMLRRMLGEDTALRVALDPDVGRVLVDPAQIVQVLMNLCVNARDAMGAGGSIFIETRAEPGSAVLIVSDSGPGMADDVKARAFEPFFTTKPVGKGTGLGLAVVHGIVEQAGGSIELTSELGKGTSFRIRIPVVAAAPEQAAEVVWSPVAGAERILLVDDDEPLRAACARALEKLGYEVIQARDGIEALRVLRSGREIDLLVTDVVMPNMNGPELAEVAMRELPGLRVLYTSGYPGDELGQRGVEHAEVALLEKPFRPHALASKIRELIDPAVPAPRCRRPSSSMLTTPRA